MANWEKLMLEVANQSNAGYSGSIFPGRIDDRQNGVWNTSFESYSF